jgi:enoyl-CoA hydratase/carnithine racemase
MLSNDAVLFQYLSEHVALVTLNRPGARNAVNGALTAALDEIVWRTEADPQIWISILAASGEKAFCAGADLKEVAAGRAALLTTARGGFAGFVDAARRKPWIAAPNAPALGGGLELCLACDMVVAAESATFGLPEVHRGVLALAGGLYRLPRAIPRAIALEMIATGRPIDTGRAVQLGLINQTAPPNQAVPVALQLALQVCEGSPLAIRESLAIARIAAEESVNDLRQLGREAMARVAATQDFREGLRAFADRTKPRWTGT